VRQGARQTESRSVTAGKTAALGVGVRTPNSTSRNFVYLDFVRKRREDDAATRREAYEACREIKEVSQNEPGLATGSGNKSPQFQKRRMPYNIEAMERRQQRYEIRQLKAIERRQKLALKKERRAARVAALVLQKLEDARRQVEKHKKPVAQRVRKNTRAPSPSPSDVSSLREDHRLAEAEVAEVRNTWRTLGQGKRTGLCMFCGDDGHRNPELECRVLSRGSNSKRGGRGQGRKRIR